MNIMSWLETINGLGFQVMRTLLSLLWQSSILLVAAALLTYALRKRRASVRHALWIAALLSAPALPLLAWVGSYIQAPQAEIPVMPTYSASPAPSPAPPVKFYEPSPSESAPAPLALEAAEKNQFSITDYPWALALLVYASGLILFLSLVVIGRLRIGRWIRKGAVVTNPHILGAFRTARKKFHLRRGFIVVESKDVQAPMTIRTFHPVVLLPTGLSRNLSDNELRAVAIHEMAHIKRNDALLLMLASFVRAVLFFHPLVWLACRQISLLAEEVADDAVLEATREPIFYARMLTRLAEGLTRRSLSTELAAGIILSKSAFLRRVEAILSDRRQAIRKLSRLALIFTILAVIISLAIATALPLGERGPRGIVRLPDGTPLAGAEVILCTPSQEAYIRNGRHLPKKDRALTVHTGRNGQFSFVPQTGAYTIVVVQERGYAEVTAEELSTSQDVVVQPWGQVEGTLRIGAEPGANKSVRLWPERAYAPNPPIVYSYITKTDASGHFVFECVPPGEGKVGRQIGLYHNRATTSHCVYYKVTAGETVRVEIGGTGRPVIGRIVVPAEAEHEIDWTYNHGAFTLKEPRVPVPKELKDKGAEAINAWYRAQNLWVKNYTVKIEPDGRFRVEDVPAGRYQLNITVREPQPDIRLGPGDLIGSVYQEFVVPEMPGGRSNEPLDLGTLKLHEPPNVAEAEQIEKTPEPTAAEKAGIIKDARNPSNWKFTFSGGVTVELVGVSYNPSKDQPWWRPDGSPLTEAPYDKMGGRVFPDEQSRAYEFAIRVPGLREKDIGTKWEFIPSSSGAGGGTARKGGKRLKDVRATAATLPKSEESVTLRFGVATGAWETAAAMKGPGGSSARGLRGGVVIFSPPYQTGDELRITVSDNIFSRECRIVLVDVDGRTHKAKSCSASRVGEIRQITTRFDKLPLEEVKEFCFQTRGYEWVEFQNISLRPGPSVKSDEPAWGEAVEGVQAGLAFELGKRPYRVGETVSFLFKVRNVSDKTIKLSYFEPALLGWAPTVVDAEGNKVYVWVPVITGPVQIVTRSLAAGEVMELGKVWLRLSSPHLLSTFRYIGSIDPSLNAKPGKYKVSQTYRFDRHGHGPDYWSGELTTGELELKIIPAEREKEKSSAEARAAIKAKKPAE